MSDISVLILLLLVVIALVAARDRGEIGDDTRLAVENEIDLEEEKTIL